MNFWKTAAVAIVVACEFGAASSAEPEATLPASTQPASTQPASTQPANDRAFASADCQFEVPAGFAPLKEAMLARAGNHVVAIFLDPADASASHAPKMIMLQVDDTHPDVTVNNLDALTKGVAEGMGGGSQNANFTPAAPKLLAGRAGRGFTGTFLKNKITLSANMTVCIENGKVFVMTIVCDSADAESLPATADAVLTSFKWNN